MEIVDFSREVCYNPNMIAVLYPEVFSMIYDVQKAGALRRIAAGLFDIIILIVLATGLSWGISALTDADAQYQAVQDVYTAYGEKHNVNVSHTEEDLATLPAEELEQYNKNYQAAMDEMNADPEAISTMMRFWSTALSTISLSVLIAHLLLEFLVPLWLKNGQTFGQKAFGIGLMRKDGVMISPFALFVRSILGKATIEVLLPLLLVFMMFMGIAGVLIYLVLALVVAQVMLLLMHPNRCVLHDLMGCTIAVDISSQMIFRSPEALIAYQKERAAEKAEKASY